MDHPNVFRFEGKLWVSERPAEEARGALAEQRAWDAATARAQRWWIAIAIGAALGLVVVLALSTAAGIVGFLYLIVLPVGIAIGSVLGAVVNKRFNPNAGVAPATPRPVVPELHRVTPSVARRIPDGATAAEIIALARR
jgi:hypothetical protein